MRFLIISCPFVSSFHVDATIQYHYILLHVANKASIKDLTHSKFCCLQPPTVPFLLKLQTSQVQHMIVCRYTGVFVEYTDNILNTLVQGINCCFYHMSKKHTKRCKYI